MDADRYYTELAAAFVRGKIPALARGTDDEVIALGLREGLRLHKFKQQAELPRVRRVLGILRGLGPESLLDVGSGRGTFLWPVLAAFPELPVLAIDLSEQRAKDLDAVRAGGVTRLRAEQMDARRMSLGDGSVDVVTMLEVLEHMPEPDRAAAEALRVARRFVLASVPSHEDDNPEHIHLFDPATLTRMFVSHGAAKVTCEHVLNHIVAVVRR